MEVFTIAPADTRALWLIGLIPLFVVPTTEGYGVLVSPSEPDTFLAALNALAAGR